MKQAATYTRSSKDRSDGCAIADQDRTNAKLAAEHELMIVEKYSDVVESAKDEFRPDFQRLLSDMQRPNRAWDTLIIYDTSRLFRKQYLAQAFQNEARQCGVKVIFHSIPDNLDHISRMMLESQFQVMDEMHSVMCKQKGMAAMAENIRAGYRAGGIAPRGYDLQHTPTGAIRDSKPVMKSKLVPNGDAILVRQYLRLRIDGLGRVATLRRLKLNWPDSSMVELEWNALTYAGCTVWSAHSEFKKGSGYVGGKKRRPRKDWLVTDDTHHALITKAEAEMLITRLENNKHNKRRQSPAKHLLVGLLKTPCGAPWYGNGGTHYRTAKQANISKYVRMELIDKPILERIVADMSSKTFVQAMLKASQTINPAIPMQLKDIRQKEKQLSKKISGLLHIAIDLDDPKPICREIDALEVQRKAYEKQLEAMQQEIDTANAVMQLSEDKIHQMLLKFARKIEQIDRESLKVMLTKLCDKILLDPETLQCEIHYKFRAEDRNRLASPRGFEPLLPP